MGIYPKEESRDTHVHSSIMQDNQTGEPAPVSINRRMDQQNVLRTMDCYSILKRKEILTQCVRRFNLKP